MNPGTTAKIKEGIAGATITAGQTVYLDPTTATYKLADANAGGYAVLCAGIALHNASSGQPLAVQYAGKITIGATVAVGTVYVVSGTAGGIAPHADLLTGIYTSILGVAVTTGIIDMLPDGPFNSQVAVP